VTGGAGYIGSATATLLLEQGWDVTIFDNLSPGHGAAVPAGASFGEGDIRDRSRLAAAFKARPHHCLLHFAARACVGESFPECADYFEVNVGGTSALLAAALEAGVDKVVFSSSCTVYGQPDSLPIDESAPVKKAVSPYGQSKQTCETMLSWLARTQGVSFVSLRYFNAAGAWGERGEDHRPETHLIPLVIDAARGKVARLSVFGRDYPTRDGTCVRDYIHIKDLAAAHLLAAEGLVRATLPTPASALPGGLGFFINLGTGRGHTILEVIGMVEEITSLTVPHEFAPRRAGDPPELVAANGLARRILGWEPRHSSLRNIVETATRWRAAHPDGYAA